MKCVNKSLPEYKSLKEKTGLPDLVLSSIITEFQFKFKNDEFPSMGYINNRPAFNRDEQLKAFYDTDSGQTFSKNLNTKDKLEILKKYKSECVLKWHQEHTPGMWIELWAGSSFQVR